MILLCVNGGNVPIQRVSATGGVAADATSRKGLSRFPLFLPDGRHFLYTVGGASVDQRGVYLASLDGKESRRVLPDVSSVIFAAGRLLFVRENSLMAQPFDAASEQLRGEVLPVGEGVFKNGINYAPVTVSDTGMLIYLSSDGPRGNQIGWYSREGKLLEVVVAPGNVFDPAISPDGKSVAFRRVPGDNTGSDLWVRDLTRRAEQRITADAYASGPVWSPQGDGIAFDSFRGDGIFNLYKKATGGTGQGELLLANGNNKWTSQWSRDGRFIVYTEVDPKTKRDIWLLPMEGGMERKPIPFLRSAFNELLGQLSPDSHWMAYTSDESGQREVYVRPFPAGADQWKISIGGGDQPRWRGDGRELFFVVADKTMMAVPVKAKVSSGWETKRSFAAGAPQALFEASLATALANNVLEYDVTADGKHFLLATSANGSAASAAQLIVVSNWTVGLKK